MLQWAYDDHFFKDQASIPLNWESWWSSFNSKFSVRYMFISEVFIMQIVDKTDQNTMGLRTGCVLRRWVGFMKLSCQSWWHIQLMAIWGSEKINCASLSHHSWVCVMNKPCYQFLFSFFFGTCLSPFFFFIFVNLFPFSFGIHLLGFVKERKFNLFSFFWNKHVLV